MSEMSQFLKREVARLKEENERLNEELNTLRQYAEAIQALAEAIDQLDPREEVRQLLDRILYNALALVNSQDGSLLVVDEDTAELVFVLTRGDTQRPLQDRRIPIGKGIAGWVAYHLQPTIVNNATVDDRFYAGLEGTPRGTASVLAAPIVGAGRLLGVLEIVNRQDGRPFNVTDQALVMLLCRFAGQVLGAMAEEEEGSVADEAQDYYSSPPSWPEE